MSRTDEDTPSQLLVRNAAHPAVRRALRRTVLGTKIRGFLHLYIGEEAIAVGVMSALDPDDAVVATYREHGHALARGVSPALDHGGDVRSVEGCSRGRGGSMHLFDAAVRFYGGNAIVGGGLPLAAGLALAARMQRRATVDGLFLRRGRHGRGRVPRVA